MKKLILIILVFVCYTSGADNFIDSLRSKAALAPNDSARIIVYFSAASGFFNNPLKAIEIAAEMTRFADKIKNEKEKAYCLRKVGVIYHQLNFYDKALEYSFAAAKLYSAINDQEGLANCYNNIANSYKSKGALTSDQLLFDKAIEYHTKCIAIREEINDTLNLKNSYNNISLVYIEKKDYDKAIKYLLVPYEYYKRSHSYRVVLNMTATNLGTAWLLKAETENKPEYFRKALSYFHEVLAGSQGPENTEGYAFTLEKVGKIYLATGDKKEALASLLQAYDINKKIGDILGVSTTAELLAEYYEQSGDYRKTVEYLKIHLRTRDSLLNLRNKSNADQLQILYKTNEKDKEIEKLNNDKLLKDVALNKQRIIIFSSVGGLVLIILLAFVISRNLYRTRRTNEIIKKQKEEVEHQKELVEENRKEIIDSIHYARRIQQALLTNKQFIDKYISNFIFFSPKDIVSGDFYWATQHHNRFYLACCDSTGHGVPGAFMSLLNIGFLSEAINEKNILQPNEVFSYVRKRLIESISDEQQRDGFDGILLCIETTATGKQITYAAANNAPILVSNNTLTELEKDRMPVGKGENMNPFNLYHLPSNGGMLYLYTDGYADQFGGPKGKKFKYKTLNDLLLAISSLALNDQRKKIEERFHDWKGNLEQVDDVCIIGIRL